MFNFIATARVFCILSLSILPVAAESRTLFNNSVVSHDIDLISSDYPTVPAEVEFVGTGRREMPDSRKNTFFDENAHIYKVVFADKTVVEVWVHSDFTSRREIEPYINLLPGPLGKLPKTMRHTLRRVILQKGDGTAFSEHLGHFFILYSENAVVRFANHDLEETVFHESVHATLDKDHARSHGWRQAQSQDNRFVTVYGKRNAIGEDLAETALFAFSLRNESTQIPDDVKLWLEENIPHRLDYLNKMFDDMEQSAKSE